MLTIFLGFFLQSRAQNSLAGKVTDHETGAPVYNAVIYIADLKRGTLTDSLGYYEMNGLPAGKFLLTASSIGFTAKNSTVDIQGQTIVDILMETSHMEVNEVVVTGVSHATELKRSPIPTTVIGRDELMHSTGTNIIAAISGVPGVAQLSTGSGISKPVIRGLGASRVVTLYDGIRQEGQQWGDEHGIEIDQFSVDRVEILKGPASLMYGSDALGGVINLLVPLPPPEGKLSGDIRAEYQSNSRLHALSGSFSGNKKGIIWLVRATQKQAANYQNRYDGPVYNSGFNEGGFNGLIGINRSWGYSHLALSVLNQTFAMPEGERDSLTGRFTGVTGIMNGGAIYGTISDFELTEGYRIKVPSQAIAHFRLSSNNSFMIGKNRLSVNAGFQNNGRGEYDDPVNALKPGISLSLSTITYDVKYFITERKGWEPVIGINGMYQSNLNDGVEFIIPDYRLFDAGLFAFAKKSFEKLDISGGVRFDFRTISADALYLKDDKRVDVPDSNTFTQFAGFSTHFQNISGSIGASYTLAKNVFLKTNIARGFRSPNIAELSANGVHEGTFRYEIGSSSLKPETSLQEDIGFYAESKHVSVDLALFNNDISNYIYLEKILDHMGGDSIIDADEPMAAAYRFVQGSARLAGAEGSIDIHPHPFDWLHFENTVSFVHGINKSAKSDQDKYLPFIPAARTRSELRADIAKPIGKLPLKNSYIKLEAEHFFPQNRIFKVGNTETVTPGYTLLHAGLGTSITRKSGKVLMNLVFDANNILDTAYQDHLSRLKYAGENFATGRRGIYNMGRNFTVLLNVPF